MNTISLLQVSESVVVKSAEMAEKDPHGLIITAVSVSVVFAALIILYFAYTFVGKVVNNRTDWKKLMNRLRARPDQNLQPARIHLPKKLLPRLPWLSTRN